MMQHQSFKNKPRSSRMAWAKRLIALYPASWRERYADEMLMVLEERPPTLWTFGDLLLNLCDAHLHTEIVPGKIPTMFKQLHASVTTIFCACLLFCMLTAHGFVYFDFLKTWQILMTHSRSYAPDRSYLFYIPYALLLSYLFLFFVGVPLLFSTCWQALRRRHRCTFFLCLAGILSLLVALPAEVAAIPLSPTYNSIERFSATLTTFISLQNFLSFVLISIPSLVYNLFVCIGTGALWIAFQQSTPTTRLTKFLLVPAMLIPLIMLTYIVEPLFSLVLALSWLLAGGENIASFVYRWCFSMSSLLTLLLIAWYALLRIYQARRTTPTVKV